MKRARKTPANPAAETAISIAVETMVVSMAEEDSEPQISEVFLHGGRSKYGFVRFAFNFKDTVFFLKICMDGY